MILGYTEQFFDQLLAADRELASAVIALGKETEIERYLPPRERQHLERVLNAYVQVGSKINDLIRPVKTEPAQMFWKGFAFALEAAGREDLFAQYPAAADAATLIEAECLLMSDTPPVE